MSSDVDASSTRDKVLATIRTAPTPPTVEEIAASLNLHHNSVRMHAAALKDAGLITQENRPGGGRGRPQTTYRTSSRGAWTGRRDYHLLASLLLSELDGGSDKSGGESSDDPAAATATAARRVGRSWGRRIAGDVGSGGDDDVQDRVVAVLDELGFEPTVGMAPVADATDATDEDAAAEIELRNCPFRELVDPHDGAVCALHAGMLDGLAGPDIELIPFTSPQACTVRMHTR